MKIILSVLVLLACASICAADTLEVRVGDFYYNPSALNINEGDTVKWIWDSGGHDVVSGPAQSSDGAFESESYLSTGPGSVFSVVFDRNLLNAFPKIGNQYPYYCTPHINMLGSVSVTRVVKPFRAEAASWQVVPPTNSSALGDFRFNLSGDESTLTISQGDHNVTAAQSIVLRQQSLGVVGGAPLNCTIVVGPPASGSCAISSTQADALFSGDVSIEIRSSSYLGGEIRGQIYISDSSSHSISGRVLDEMARSVEAVTVSSGNKSALTNSLGQYTIPAVTNGVQQLSATYGSYVVLPNAGVSPLLINGNDAFNRDLTVFIAITPTPSPTPTPLSTLCGGSASAIEILSPNEGAVLKTFDVPIQLQGGENFTATTYSINAGAAQSLPGATFVINAKSGANIFSLQPKNASGSIQCPVIERYFTVDSTLSLSILEAVVSHLSKALKTKDSKRRKRALSKINSLLESMASGGNANPEYPSLTNSKINKALALSQKANKSATQSGLAKVLKRLKRLLAQLTPQPQATPTPKPTATSLPGGHHHNVKSY